MQLAAPCFSAFADGRVTWAHSSTMPGSILWPWPETHEPHSPCILGEVNFWASMHRGLASTGGFNESNLFKSLLGGRSKDATRSKWHRY